MKRYTSGHTPDVTRVFSHSIQRCECGWTEATWPAIVAHCRAPQPLPDFDPGYFEGLVLLARPAPTDTARRALRVCPTCHRRGWHAPDDYHHQEVAA